MGNNFFDETILDSTKGESENFPILNNYNNLKYFLKRNENHFQIHVEINGERLNSIELKALLKLNEKKKFLSGSDVEIISYLAYRLVGTISIYKILTDIGFFLNHLRDSAFDVFYEGNLLIFSNEEYKLDLNLFFNERNNIELDVKTPGELIFSFDKVYLIRKKVLYKLTERIPINFYKEVFSGNNEFSIETFFSLKKSLLGVLKETQNLTISEEIENLSNLNVSRKKAKVVAEISKTSHFIVMALKYKVGNELFNINDYKYADNINWLDKNEEIKIIKEDDELVQYVSDLELSEDIFREIFNGFRVRYSQNSKEPFVLMIPISNLEVFIKDVIPKIKTYFDIEYKNGVPLRLADGNVHFEVETNLKSRLDLFEFKVRFRIENEYFDLDFLKNLIQQNKKFVQLKDGVIVNIENVREINKWIEFLKRFEFKKTDNKYKTKSQVALELDEFLKDFKGKKIKSNDEYKNMITELKDKKPVVKIELPEHLKYILRDYQKEGVFWMHFLRKYGFGGILADEMGLGKTIQALTLLSMIPDKTHIVICPKTLIYNWESEVKKYFPDLKVLIISGDIEKRKRLIKKCPEYNIVITSYSMLQKDYKDYVLNNIKFGYSILDEAHYVKNMKTLSAKAVRLINSENIILLTGTPLENNLDELYSTFDLIMPGYLGSKLEFNREFISKIERNNMIALEILQAKIKPFILRRVKKQVLKELPDKQEQVVFSEMTNKQVAIYSEVLERVKNDVNQLIEKQGFNRSRIQVLSALLKLRQICNHPHLIDNSLSIDADLSGKYGQFLELLSEVIVSGKKVLVFSQFTSMLDIMEKDLKRLNINFFRLDGSTKNRQELVENFNSSDSVKVFLISLKAGGVGINLTSASVVFLYDPWWNPMVEKQAMDRVHRIGQTKKVNVYKFITKNSIEEKIMKLQERKGTLFENLITDNSGFMKRLEWEDLMELFD